MKSFRLWNSGITRQKTYPEISCIKVAITLCKAHSKMRKTIEIIPSATESIIQDSMKTRKSRIKEQVKAENYILEIGKCKITGMAKLMSVYTF